MKRTQSWRWGMVAAFAALLVVPSLAQAQGAIQVTVDSPSGNPTLYNGQTVDIGGWAVDDSAPSGTGVDSVEIFVDVQNGVAAQRIVADYGTRRPDVAQAFGRPDWV